MIEIYLINWQFFMLYIIFIMQDMKHMKKLATY